MSLFRKEAVSHQSVRLAGDISLAQPLSIKTTVAIISTIALIIVGFLCTANYARKETVRGFVLPSKGMIKAYASQGGIIQQLHVSQGQQVKKGDTLATLILPQTTANGEVLSEQQREQINQQVVLLNEEIQQRQQLAQQQNEQLQNTLAELKGEYQSLNSQLTLADEKLALLNQQQQQFNQLSSQGYLSALDKDRQQQNLLEAKQEKQSVQRALLQQQQSISQTQGKIERLPQESALSINNLKRQQAELQRTLVQVNASDSYTVIASHSGTITSLQVVEGETLTVNKPLLHILPKGSELVAELLLPTRSAGFVQAGQRTRLRFDAFPYQRFGFVEGEITRVDQALLAPNEVQLPIALQEPVYRLRAKMNQQQIQAYGQGFALKSGMLLEADIQLEQRSLIQWLLEPLYSIHGKLG